MAKGLFQVFVDPTASRPAASSRATSGRKGLREAAGKDPSSWSGKENFDPFARTDLGLFAGKGGKKAVVTKLSTAAPKHTSVVPVSCSGSGSGEQSFRAPAARAIPPKSSASTSTNGICTGTLRTRVLPTVLPPQKPAQTTLGHRSSAPLDVRQILDASPASLLRLQGLASRNSSWTDLEGSPGSARDSGYARSEGASETDDDSDDDGGEDQTVTIPCDAERETDEQFDRRARALTESPLAEVTQAFTGLGGFCVPPPPESPTRRPTVQRIRTSPSHSAATASSSHRAVPAKKPYAVPVNVAVPTAGPQPVKKHAKVKSDDGSVSLCRGARALRM